MKKLTIRSNNLGLPTGWLGTRAKKEKTRSECHNKRHEKRSMKLRSKGIVGVDLFCGAGGLTRGLETSGINMSIGIDIDPACEYPYTVNNSAAFLRQSVEEVSGADFSRAYRSVAYKLLAGCAPCQPFSTYSQGKSSPSDNRWNLLEHFARLIQETKPDLVTMENVPRLAREQVFSDFVSILNDEGFAVFHDVVNCADYGVPQQRRRLVLLASKLGSIELIQPTSIEGHRPTVRDAIEALPPLCAGEVCASDPLHQACGLSPLNLRRIRASKPGGTWRDWDKKLMVACHKREAGKTYTSVYGRMSWDKPSPTMTTQYCGFGNGRFGHPKQNRAISIREGAILQSFPCGYEFVREGAPVNRQTLARLIGNAVPVKLGEAIGKSFIRHIRRFSRS